MRREIVRAGVAAVGAAVVVGVVAVVGEGSPAQDVRLLSGAAWFASAKVGQLTLLDGASAEVSAQVQVAPAGNLLEVVQQGSHAYAVDQSVGTVRRVDGATFELTDPETPIPDARGGLTAVAGPTALYTLDVQRGILASTDPRTLARRGDMISVSARLTAGTATVDDNGTLWTIDTATGNLHRVVGERRFTHQAVAKPGPSIVSIANGHPVIVDRAGRKAVEVDSTGSVIGTFDLDLREDDTLQVSGSPHSERLYIIAGRGVLTICELAANTCDNAIPLSTGNEFGAAVETANRLFVPNYTTGEVWIIDLAASRVIAKPAVLKAGKFQLLSRDGVVFYNDVESEKAGVIHLDGKITPTAKYDPANPNLGLNTPAPNSGNPGVPPSQASAPQNPSQPQVPNHQQQQSNQPQESNQPIQPPPDPSSPNAPRLKITMSDTTPQADQPIEIRVENTSGSPVRSATWTFGDGNSGAGVSTSHKWAAPRDTPYQVSVSAVMEDGQQGVLAIPVQVSNKPTFKLTVQVPGGGGTVTGHGISCPGTCSTDVVADTVIDLTATPDSTHLAGTWTGCTSTTNRCSVTMTNANKTVSHAFTVAPPEMVTLKVTTPSGGKITGDGINCPGTCTKEVRKGTDITLSATPSATVSHEVGTWGGVCASRTSTTCPVSVDADDTTVSVSFKEKPKFTIVVRAQRGDPPGNGSVSIDGGTPCDTNCAINRTAYRDEVLVLTAKAAPREPPRHFYFSGWEGASCTSAQTTCHYTVRGNATVTAIFKFTAA